MKLREWPRATQVYQWASEYTTESILIKLRRTKDQKPVRDFYETETFKRLVFKLQNQRRALIGILGLQGSGKTRTLYELQNYFRKRIDREAERIFHLKWSKNWFKDLLDGYLDVSREYKAALRDTVSEKLRMYGEAGRRHPNLGRVPHRGDLRDCENEWPPYKLRNFLTKTELNALKEQSIYIDLMDARYVFVDMPDYTKSTAHSMNRDIDNLQEFWQRVQADQATRLVSFVIAFQKEMVMRHPHFFIGKLDIVTLKPLNPQELIEAYKLRNETIEPFTEEALQLIGELSRGIFRRFQKYIQITVERNLDEEIPLTAERVNNAITEDLLIADMELELSDVFKRKDKKTEAVRILNFIRQQGECNMKTIAEELNLGKGVVERLIQKLYGYRYVEIKRGKGKEKLVSLKL